MVRMLIVGTGDHANGLAHLFAISNCRASGNFLEVTKPSITKKGGVFHDTGVPLVPFNHGLCNADVVVLAIPAAAIKKFMTSYASFLKGKIIVDATNSSIPGKYRCCISHLFRHVLTNVHFHPQERIFTVSS